MASTTSGISQSQTRAIFLAMDINFFLSFSGKTELFVISEQLAAFFRKKLIAEKILDARTIFSDHAILIFRPDSFSVT